MAGSLEERIAAYRLWLTRKILAYSKRLRSLRAEDALYVGCYRFVRPHHSLRVTSAMEASVSQSVWDLDRLSPLLVLPAAVKRGRQHHAAEFHLGRSTPLGRLLRTDRR